MANIFASGSVLGLSLALIAFTTIVSISSVKGQEEIECRGQELNITVAQKAIITDCLREAKILSLWKIPPERVACFGVCILEKKNLLTADGKLDHDKIYDYIFHVMQPEEVKKPLVDGTEKCIKDHGVKVKADGDPNCQTFMETGQCVHDVFLDICVIG